MATYLDFISELRSEVGDFTIKRFETADGDAETTVFQLANPKISDETGTLSVKIGGTPTTDYTRRDNVAQIIFNTAPASGNDNVSFEYESVNEKNDDWIVIINDVLDKLRKKIWREFLDEGTLSTVAFQGDYDLTTITSDILSLVDIEYRRISDNSSPWVSVLSTTNVTFYKDLQKIRFYPPIDVSGWELRIRGLRAFTKGSSISSSFEPDGEYWSPIKKYCAASYFRRRAADMTREVSAVSKEDSFERPRDMLAIAREYEREGDSLMASIRLPKPSKRIPIKIGG